MTDFISDGAPYETPLAAANEGYEATAPGFGAFLGAQVGEGVSAFLARAAQRGGQAGSSTLDRALAEYQAPGDAEAQAFGFAPPAAAPEQSPVLSPDDYNKRFAPIGPDGKPVPLGDRPMQEGLARTIGQQKADALQREGVIARFEGAHSWPINLGAGVIGSMLDPVNAAAALVPPLGEEMLATRLGALGLTGLAGRTLARAGAGALTGAAIALPQAGVEAALAPEEATDYSLGQALREVGLSAAGFAALHAVGGAAGDAYRAARGRSPRAGIAPEGEAGLADAAAPIVTAPAAANRDALAAATAQLGDGRPVDVAPIVTPEAAPETTLADVAASQRLLDEHGYGTGIAPDEFADTQDAVYNAPQPAAPVPTEAAGAQIGEPRPTAPSGDAALPGPSAGAGDATAAEGEATLPKAPAVRIGPRVTRPPDLVQFLAAQGGLEPSGDLAAMDAHKKFVPGAGMLVRRAGQGLDHDHARELAQEAGYLPADNPHAPSQSTIGDLYDAIAETLRGNPRYSVNDAGRVLDYADYQRRLAEARMAPEERAQAIADAHADRVGDIVRQAREMGYTLTDDEAAHAADLIGAGRDPEAAIDEAVERGGFQHEGLVRTGKAEEDIPDGDEPAAIPVGAGTTGGADRIPGEPGGEPRPAGTGAAGERAPRDEPQGAGATPRQGAPQDRAGLDPDLVAAQRLYDAAPTERLGPEDRAELDASEAGLRDADDAAGAAETAGRCLGGELP